MMIGGRTVECLMHVRDYGTSGTRIVVNERKGPFSIVVGYGVTE